MKYSVAAVVLAAAGSVSAWYPTNDTVVYTTEIVDVYTTVCPAGSAVTYNGHTYTNTETDTSTIVITDCPCTISKPIYTTSAVAAPSSQAPVYPNATTPVATAPVAPTTPVVVGTTYVPSPTASTVPASGANKAFAMSGASLAGLLGLAAYLL